MQLWQLIIVVLFAVYSVVGFTVGFRKTYYKKNPFGLSPYLNPIGAFVWADAVVFSVFFFAASVIALLARNFTLFLLIYSVFWMVRSIGEQAYWFLEQFAVNHRNPPHTLKGSKIFHGGSIWVYYQIFWQCVSVVAIISTVYLFVALFS